MGIVSSVLESFGYTRTKATGSPSVIAAMLNGMMDSRRPTAHDTEEILKRYADQAWVYACVSIIASKAASVPIKIYKQGNDRMEEVEDHPIKKLLDDANPHQTGKDLMEASVGFAVLAGNSYWLLDNFKNGLPTEIYTVPPHQIKVRADREKYVAGYAFEPTPGVVARVFPPEEVLHFRTWNPLDQFYGMAPISAGRDASDSLMMADRFNKSFFSNSAEPGGVLTTDNVLDGDAVERIRKVWNETHRGERKSHKVAVLEGGLKWLATGSTHRDMQFGDLKRMTREDILAVYRIPPVMVGVFDEANYANSREQRRIFWQDTMVPWLSKFLGIINERLVKPFDPAVQAGFDLSVVEDMQDDKKMAAEEDEILTRSGILTINEARAKRRLPPVPWGSTWNTSVGIVPIDAPRPSGEPAPETPPEDGEDGDDGEDQAKAFQDVAKAAQDATGAAKALAEAIGIKGGEESPPPIEPAPAGPAPEPSAPEPAPVVPTIPQAEDKGAKEREARWYQFKDFTEKWEKNFKAEIVKLFQAQRAEVMENVKELMESAARQARLNGKSIEPILDAILFNGSDARKAWRKVGRRLMETVLSASGRDEADRLDLGQFSINDPRVVAWLDEKAFKFANAVNQTTEDAIREAVSAGYELGESVDKISERIAQVFDQAADYRSERIARTEVVGAANKGTFEAYAQSGIVEEIEWITARDGDVRPSHQIDGEKVGLGAVFSNGLRYPGDPAGSADEVINCRCDFVAVVNKRG